MSNLVNANGEYIKKDVRFKNSKRRLIEEIDKLRDDLKKISDEFLKTDQMLDEMEKTFLTTLIIFKKDYPDHEYFKSLNIDIDAMMKKMEIDDGKEA